MGETFSGYISIKIPLLCKSLGEQIIKFIDRFGITKTERVVVKVQVLSLRLRRRWEGNCYFKFNWNNWNLELSLKRLKTGVAFKKKFSWIFLVFWKRFSDEQLRRDNYSLHYRWIDDAAAMKLKLIEIGRNFQLTSSSLDYPNRSMKRNKALWLPSSISYIEFQCERISSQWIPVPAHIKKCDEYAK